MIRDRQEKILSFLGLENAARNGLPDRLTWSIALPVILLLAAGSWALVWFVIRAVTG
jgi:hypothetical protein